jgi:hypothetical protein
VISGDLRLFAEALLSFLEERETRLLGWGFYDVAFDPAEVEELLQTDGPAALAGQWAELAAQGCDLTSLISDMEHEGLLQGVSDRHGLFRTRFAEGVRLIARLRQMFRPGDWADARRLVSDIKIHLAQRRYPRRDVSAAACWPAMAPQARDPDLQRAVFDALARGRDGKGMDFAGFQKRAFSHILGRYGEAGRSGSIVCAGTGSGKTKAFYVPAFLGIATELSPAQPRFTKVMAVYPRNVLLADQLREAMAEARKLRATLSDHRLRPLTFGALTGDTPPTQALERPDSLFMRNWRRTGTGWVLPSLRSPVDGRSELLWRDVDRRAGRTCLYRLDGDQSAPEIEDGVIALTREALQESPPDILFLSIEMLSRELGNSAWARTLGIGVGDRAPRLLLFDEVHTYAGLGGAQASWIVRRWRFAARPRALHIVGLSATLRYAAGHLSRVAGLRSDTIAEFGPAEDELVSEGREYNLAVKGDPSSGASLLATSIQCAMLVSRLLTPAHAPTRAEDQLRGEHLYARKVFGFTDNLDGLNRWFADLSDAERKRLARLRAPPARTGAEVLPPNVLAMRADGQIWDLPYRLGHDLQQAARVSRCSSQDPGANAASDIIVATSSLEVGFDDPEVGAMLHHKAPRSMASLLQRKGRAGRRRGTRPLTVVVLSDYGNDRWFFQNSERLFEPSLDRIRLPITNPYVLRVQATAFLIDWLGRKVRERDPYDWLRRPNRYRRAAQERAAGLLRDMAALGPAFAEFRRDLTELVRQAMLLERRAEETKELVDAILWDAPRPVLRHVVPALLRKLERNWTFAEPGRSGMVEDEGCRQPVPQYLPAASFAELDAAEIPIAFPSEPKKEPASFGLGRALIEACPGRVSKRYSVLVRDRGYWLRAGDLLLAPTAPASLPVAALFPGSVAVLMAGDAQVYEPTRLDLVQRPASVKDSSNAQWVWRSEVEFRSEGQRLPAFLGAEWAGAIERAEAHLHKDQAGVRITRYARSFRYSLLQSNGVERRGQVQLASFTSGGVMVPEAVGFEHTVDALRIRFRSAHLSAVPELAPDALARLRQDFLLDLILRSPTLADAASPFALRWVWQTSLAMLTATALRNGVDLRRAQALLCGKRAAAAAVVVRRMFGGLTAEDAEDRDETEEDGILRQRVQDLWEAPVLLDEIERAERALWGDHQEQFEAWLRERHCRTMAEAALDACGALTDNIGEGDLVADIVAAADGTDLVISETSPGGIGQVEALAASIARSPEVFEDALLHALEHCERQQTDATLLACLEACRGDSPLVDAFAAVRTAQGYAATQAAKEALGSAMSEAGLEPSRSSMVSVMGRLLRPGSRPWNDTWALGLNRAWRRLGAKVGSPLDPRVMAYLCVSVAPARRRTAALLQDITGHAPTDAQVVAMAQDNLLTGCEDSCPHCLQITNRFVASPAPSRALSLQWLGMLVPRVEVGPDILGWVRAATLALGQTGRVDIAAGHGAAVYLARGLQAMLAQEVERGYVLAPVSVAGFRRTGASLVARLRLKVGIHV